MRYLALRGAFLVEIQPVSIRRRPQCPLAVEPLARRTVVLVLVYQLDIAAECRPGEIGASDPACSRVPNCEEVQLGVELLVVGGNGDPYHRKFLQATDGSRACQAVVNACDHPEPVPWRARKFEEPTS